MNNEKTQEIEQIINISPDFLQEVINTLERCLIILEDNPNIKDVAGFYSSDSLIWEINDRLQELKK